MRTRHGVRRVPFVAPAPFGVEVMTLAQLRAMAVPGYLAAPQRPAFHVLILTTAGTATHVVDFEPHALSPGRTAWIRPGQVQVFGDTRAAGDIVLFQPDFLIPGTRAAAVAEDRMAPVVVVHPAQARAGVDRARRALRHEYGSAMAAGRAGVAQTEVLRHLLSVLVLRVAGEAPAVGRDGPRDLAARFDELLERDFAIAHDVAHYAHGLSCSARTLARAMQAGAGETPKQAIRGRIALEARRLLAHTELPVSAIAVQLGFRDPSNFAAFFAHQTGDSPSAFRGRQRPTGP